MTDAYFDRYVDVSAETTLNAAVAYLEAHHLEADEEALSEALTRHVKAFLDQALDEAMQGFQAGMPRAAVQYFLARAAAAGRDAAKEVGRPPCNRPAAASGSPTPRSVPRQLPVGLTPARATRLTSS